MSKPPSRPQLATEASRIGRARRAGVHAIRVDDTHLLATTTDLPPVARRLSCCVRASVDYAAFSSPLSSISRSCSLACFCCRACRGVAGFGFAVRRLLTFGIRRSFSHLRSSNAHSHVVMGKGLHDPDGRRFAELASRSLLTPPRPGGGSTVAAIGVRLALSAHRDEPSDELQRRPSLAASA